MLALSPYTLIPITVLIHDWNQPGPSSLFCNHMGIQKIKRPTVFHVNGRYTLDGLRKERPKCSSSAPSHLPVPPQMKGGRAQAGCEEETGKFRSLAVHFWRGSRHPSYSGRSLFTDPLTCLNSSGNKKLLQTVAAIIRVSLQADPPFVSSMKIYIYLTLVWLLINLLRRSLGLPTQWSLSLLRCSEVCYCMLMMSPWSSTKIKKIIWLTCRCLPESGEDTSRK